MIGRDPFKKSTDIRRLFRLSILHLNPITEFLGLLRNSDNPERDCLSYPVHFRDGPNASRLSHPCCEMRQ